MTSITVQSGKVIVRNGAVGTGQACCCETPPPPPPGDQPYGGCGTRCFLRVIVDEIDNELATCEDAELPEGWVLESRLGCDDDDVIPFLRADRFLDDCDYQGLLGNANYPMFCGDTVLAGNTLSLFDYFSNPFGGYKSFIRSGYTVLPNEDNTAAWVQKFYNYDFEVALTCFYDLNETCDICDSLFPFRPRWSINARFSLYFNESRFDPSTGLVSFAERSSSRSIALNDGVNGPPVVTFSCEEIENPTPLSNAYCPGEEPPTGCVLVGLYPEFPLEITLSLDDGVTVGDVTIPWDTTADEIDDSQFVPDDFPGDMKEPGGLTVYAADRCCCFDEDGVSDYCNPLP
jgi:hypothetical protein